MKNMHVKIHVNYLKLLERSITFQKLQTNFPEMKLHVCSNVVVASRAAAETSLFTFSNS